MRLRQVHLQDKDLPATAIHFLLNLERWQLTDDESQVTCKTCQRMMERRKKYEAKNKQ